MQITANLQSVLNEFQTHSGNNSFFFSFEGIEGSGKSTQIQELKIYLETKNFEVLLLREPGGTPFGESLRACILTSQTALTPISEAYLFAASRAQLLKERVLPFLAQENKIVILDRYLDSSIAYQGHARELGVEKILNIHDTAPLNIFPNLTLYLKIDLDTSMARQKSRGDEKDYFEKENFEFYNKLIAGYDQCAEIFPNRIVTVDAAGDIESITKTVIQSVDTFLGTKQNE